jgi:hypothetical protein
MSIGSRIVVPGLPSEFSPQRRIALDYNIHLLAFETWLGDWTFQLEVYIEDNNEKESQIVPVPIIVNGVTLAAAGETPFRDERHANDLGYSIGAIWQVSNKFSAGAFIGGRFDDNENMDGSEATNPDFLFQNDYSISARYDFTDNWLIKVEAHYFDGVYRLFNERGQNPELGLAPDLRPAWAGADSWFLFAAKTTYSF